MNHIFTRMYAADVTELEDNDLYRTAYQKVSNERRKKTDSFRLSKDRRLSLGAELLLLHGLEQIGINADNIRYHYGTNGRPYLTCSQNVHFNLSHSDEIVICAVSSYEIGCDIEKISDIKLEIAKRFFYSQECQMIMCQKTAEARKEMFFRFWTLKESFIKATGLGLSLPMNSFCIHLDVNGISVEQKLNQNIYYFQELNLWKNYKCSVCGLDPEIGTGNSLPFETLKFSDILIQDFC